MSGHTLRAALVRTASLPWGLATAAVPGRGPVTAATQDSYSAWRRSQTAAALAHPEDFAEVVRYVITFADPLISDQVRDQHWYAAGRTWSADDPAE